MLPTSSRPIGALSPSRLEELRCPARVAFDQAGHSEAPSPVAAQLGTAVHRAVELLVGGLDAEEAWTTACDELTQTIGDPRDLPGARRAALRFIKRARDLLQLINELHPEHCLPEEKLVSADGTIGGTPDLLLLRQRDLVVIDHKTGFVSDDGMPKSAYERQIRLYAALATERFNRPTSRGILMSTREGIVDVDVSPSRVATDIAAAREARLRYNERAPGPQPAAPAPAVCLWCRHKARCDAFWDALSGEWRGAVGDCIVGVVSGGAQLAANGLGAIQVEVQRGTIERATPIVVADIPAELLSDVAQGEVVGVTGLRSTKGDQSLRWSANSLLESS